MRRATTLVAVVVVATVGCLGGPLGGSSDATPTPTPTDPATEDPYPDTTVSIGDGPKERPDRPATLNESTAAEYVQTFEYRYAYNGLWMNEHSEVTVDCLVESTTAVASGYNVTVQCSGYSNTQGEAPGDETATSVHADWGTRDVRYYVDANSTVRFGSVDLVE